jgi:hypothetical protein
VSDQEWMVPGETLKVVQFAAAARVTGSAIIDYGMSWGG